MTAALKLICVTSHDYIGLEERAQTGCCAGLCLEQATTVKTHPLMSCACAPPPSFSENLGHFFFIITVFPGLCGTLNSIVKESLSFCCVSVQG